MDFGNNNFEELEPRATPEPTLLKCVTDPSVPEVSLIFGKQTIAPQLHTTNRTASDEKCRAYANWKTAAFPSSIERRSIARESTNERSGGESPRQKNESWNSPSNFYYQSANARNTANSPVNSTQMVYNKEQMRAHEKSRYASAPYRERADTDAAFNYEQEQQDGMSAFASPRKQCVQAPVQNGSYNAIRSILKSSILNNSAGRPPSDVGARTDSDFESKSPLRYDRCHRRDPQRCNDGSVRSPSSPISRCRHVDERNHESETVRDLLLLVKNQNEQIKSLQSQVERLLEIHEHNVGYAENRCSVGVKPNVGSPSYAKAHENENFARNNVLVSAQKARHSRGIAAMSQTSTTEQQIEASTRCQSDATRNTIMEKKVSIGVMTSFEFSVQNNPFVSETESPSNCGGLRDCDKNASTPVENWTARNVAAQPLENINEDTESHPSSISRQSINNTQASSSDKFASRFTPHENDSRVYVDPVSAITPNLQARQFRNSGKDSAAMFPYEASNSNAMIPNLRACENRVEESSNRQLKTLSKPDVSSSPSNRIERKENIYHGQGDTNVHERKAAMATRNDSDVRINERRGQRYAEQSNSETRSMPIENTADGSFVLCSSDVELPDRSLLSLDPSIHVEMREYSSDEENEEAKRTPAVGWTFYKNVVGQVNRILQSMPNGQDNNDGEKINPITFRNDIVEKKDILNSVKTATLEQLKMLGISYAEHSQFNGEHTQKKVTFDSLYRPPVDYQTQNLTQQSSNSIAETNTSMHMKTLALKYLSDEQLADLAVHKQGVGASMKHKFLSVQGTNMSFATMNYLQRYCLVSGMQSVNPEGKSHDGAGRQKKHAPLTKEPQAPIRNPNFEKSVNKGAYDNILDITTLKQQPKLL